MADDSVNGHPVAEPAQSETPAEGTPVGERLMGLFGLAVAIGIGLIAVDLLSGGAVSRLLARPQEGGQPDGG